MTQLLVTGGAGFIGCNFARWFLDHHPTATVTIYDKLTYAGNLLSLCGLTQDYPHRYRFVQGDIGDAQTLGRVIQQQTIDLIVNFAAESHVQRSLEDPIPFLQTNVDSLYHLLEAAHRAGNVRFHQISTDEVYGHVDGAYGCVETDQLSPRNMYAATKACAEHLVNCYHTVYHLPITISRASNNVGPYQHPEKVVPRFVTRALTDLMLTIHGDGQHMRDYLHVADHCRAIDLILQYGSLGETYNIGTGRQLTTLAMAQIVLHELHKPTSLLQHVADRPCNDRRYGIDTTKIRALGWQPLFTCEEAISTTVQWYRDHSWWWKSVFSNP